VSPAPARHASLWTWVQVVLGVVLLDVILFRAGLFWRLVPDILQGDAIWGLTYRSIRAIEWPPPAPRAYVAGSSIVFLGVNQDRVSTALAHDAVPTAFRVLTRFGATAVDTALLANAATTADPWLVVIGTAVRDFDRNAPLDSPVTRVLDDSTITLPALRPRDGDTRIARHVRRWWDLYRYRTFVRTALLERLPPAADLVASRVWAASWVVPPDVPAEAYQWFFPGRITAPAWAAWLRWRETRRFADYAEFLRLNKSAGLEQYRKQTLATHGPDGNPQVEALDWAMGQLAAAGVRLLVVDFPENPVLQDPDARASYDTAVSDAIARRLATDAAAHGARFVDLRNALSAEQFYDLIHPNLEGMRTLSDRIAALVAEEWWARQP
jgi:hypothetical protein